jgi:hypothetical protein
MEWYAPSLGRLCGAERHAPQNTDVSDLPRPEGIVPQPEVEGNSTGKNTGMAPFARGGSIPYSLYEQSIRQRDG